MYGFLVSLFLTFGVDNQSVVFSRNYQRNYLPDSTQGLVDTWFPKSLSVGSQNGLFNEPVSIFNLNLCSSDEYDRMFAYQQDLTKMLVMVNFTQYEDQIVPTSICHVVYVPEPGCFTLFLITLLRRKG